MKAATALVSGHRADPELAESAVRQALEKAGLRRADSVVLLLSRDFVRQADVAARAAARVSGTLSVGGCTANGLLTEDGWQLDQPAAAALVYGESAGRVPNDVPMVSFCGQSRLPFDWQGDQPRAGLVDADATTWSHGRITECGTSTIRLPGVQARVVHSIGLRRLGEAQTVELSQSHELLRLGGQRAVDSLYRALPAELRERPPLHRIVALREADRPGIAILSGNADGSLSLAEALAPGDRITWAIRQPLAAEEEIRRLLSATSMETKAVPGVNPKKAPNFALMFSCIGRGPLFYGSDDHDLLAFRECYPDTPLLGAYGTGQIVPLAGQNRLFQNSVLTLLFESAHV